MNRSHVYSENIFRHNKTPLIEQNYWSSHSLSTIRYSVDFSRNRIDKTLCSYQYQHLKYYRYRILGDKLNKEKTSRISRKWLKFPLLYVHSRVIRIPQRRGARTEMRTSPSASRLNQIPSTYRNFFRKFSKYYRRLEKFIVLYQFQFFVRIERISTPQSNRCRGVR